MTKIHRNLTVFGAEFPISGGPFGEGCFDLTFEKSNSQFTPLFRLS